MKGGSTWWAIGKEWEEAKMLLRVEDWARDSESIEVTEDVGLC